MKNKAHSQALKDLRERFGASLQDCADVLGVGKPTYWMKEAGEREIRPDEMALLAEHFGVPLTEAFPDYQPTDGALALARQLYGEAA